MYSSHYNFYRSDKWIKFRQQFIADRLARDGAIYDDVTHKPILNKYDVILHHKIELNELNCNDAKIALNPDNIMVVSHKTHNQIHSNFKDYRECKNYIVYGPALCGKSYWVEHTAEHGDLVLDVNNIWQCVSVGDDKPQGLKNMVFNIRDVMLDDIRHRNIAYKRAYIVGTYKLEPERERLAKDLNAELIYIDTSKAECLKRAESTKNSKDYKKYIEEWFELNPTPHCD